MGHVLTWVTGRESGLEGSAVAGVMLTVARKAYEFNLRIY